MTTKQIKVSRNRGISVSILENEKGKFVSVQKSFKREGDEKWTNNNLFISMDDLKNLQLSLEEIMKDQ